MFPLGESVTLHRQGQTVIDDYGYETTEAVDVELHGVAVIPGQSTEQVDSQGVLISTPIKVITRENVAIGPHDQMTVRGQRYSVIGDTSGFRTNVLAPTSLSHTTINLRRING